MLPSAYRAQTSQAAEIAGVGYEGLRTWLKRGLLKTTGPLMPKMYAAHAPAEVTDSKRWQWSAFGFADLCAFRLMRALLDAGIPWDTACRIASHNEGWWLQALSQQDEERAADPFEDAREVPKRAIYLTIHKLKEPESNSDLYSWCLYTLDELTADIEKHIITTDHMTLIDLRDLRRDVVARINALPGAAERGATIELPADDV